MRPDSWLSKASVFSAFPSVWRQRVAINFRSVKSMASTLMGPFSLSGLMERKRLHLLCERVDTTSSTPSGNFWGSHSWPPPALPVAPEVCMFSRPSTNMITLRLETSVSVGQACNSVHTSLESDLRSAASSAKPEVPASTSGVPLPLRPSLERRLFLR